MMPYIALIIIQRIQNRRFWRNFQALQTVITNDLEFSVGCSQQLVSGSMPMTTCPFLKIFVLITISVVDYHFSITVL